jgi:hypothetical protein
MKEKQVMERVKIELAKPEVIAALGVGTRSGRWVKIPDSWATTGDGKRFIPFKGTDLVWATDCCEVKVVKAKTERGMVFHVEQLNDRQQRHLIEHDGLVAVGFIRVGNQDSLVSIAVFRFARFSELIKLEPAATISRQSLERLSYVLRGRGYEAPI